ncbi:sn-glycerol-3-phosphate ABC transporter substrate-binding protein UgpB [Phyllobacterium endophyticum]|nr:sn-glycerol-3-phosphate ABC transporter substrate-binding protein UgpB [Phyllobacterium endophyticum]MBB3237229.1 sn-glycerol 3-phosphate transport system substrate-binding protein [Phyllobacterium endophyticum]
MMALALGVCLAYGARAEPIQIQWWHSHPSDSLIGKTMERFAEEFNASQAKYQVVATYKGTYYETLNATIAAYRAKKQPAITEVLGNLTLTMMLSGAIVPVEDLVKESGYQIDWADFIPSVLNIYRDPSGKIVSMPFNASAPILWINRDAFDKAGIEGSPQTWTEVGEAARKLKAAGYPCGFTVSWQIYSQVEAYSFANDIPLATEANGMDGFNVKLLFNKTSLVNHISQLQDWAKEGIFTYTGRSWQGANEAFYSQKCPMFIESSAGLGGITTNAKFRFDAAPYPSEPGVKQLNTQVGGGSMYVMKGFSPEVYKGVAEFFAFLATPEKQFDWHDKSGYVPITRKAYEYASEKQYYKQKPIQEIAIKQLLRGPQTDNSRGFRIGDYGKITDILDEELENIWSQKKTAQQGLDDAVRRGDEVIQRFVRAARL